MRLSLLPSIFSLLSSSVFLPAFYISARHFRSRCLSRLYCRSIVQSILSLSLFLFLSRSIIRATDFRVRSGTRISYNRSSREVINILFGAGAFDRFSVCDRTKIENPSLRSLRSHSPYPSGSRSRTKRESTWGVTDTEKSSSILAERGSRTRKRRGKEVYEQ